MPSKTSYAEKKSLGTCVQCSNKAKPSHVHCIKCLHANKTRTNRKRKELCESGFCITCKSPKEDDKMCCRICRSNWSNKMFKRREDFLASGVCFECGGEKVCFDHKRCTICYLKMLSTNIFGVVNNYIDLERLLNKQGKKCRYSGRELILQDNCELDHIIPKAKGGKDELCNLQWVHRNVNKMKHDLTEQKFIQLVLEIAEKEKQDAA